MQPIKQIQVSLGDRSYEIMLKAGLLQSLNNILNAFCSNRAALVVTDSNVEPLYGEAIDRIEHCNYSKFVFPAGEKYKTVETVAAICRKAVAAGLDRKSLILALGGGVCGDMAGFAAAVYMRGIDFIQLPTTLLAMVDSSVGGKTGVDLPEGKNLVGAFWQPRLVIIDPETLKTLPVEELRNGLAEVIKYGMIRDWKFFRRLEKNSTGLKQLDLDFYTRIIARCCEIKAEIVSRDEREGGLRAILNYGHTFGHAVESLSNFSIAHGAAVAMGMAAAAELAVLLRKIPGNYAERQNSLLRTLGLPVRIPPGLEPEKIYAAMLHDKKAVGAKVKLVLPVAEGAVAIIDDLDSKLIIRAVRNCCD
ncbi:MAG: 3-dehydroquinate synthase [Victivallaceae bacterium]|nr:3-dehydroquinate synthase [Victivallaceae bacterium]